VEDAAKRIEQGYSAIAVKAIAKTLSMTMRITQLAHEKKVPCFCADLTVNPILVDWNKNIAARLAPFRQQIIERSHTVSDDVDHFGPWTKHRSIDECSTKWWYFPLPL
jgi:hypothetical protein